MRAKTAIFRARAGFGVDDGAKMDFVALEMFTDPVRPRQQIKNVGAVFDIKKPQRLLACHFAAGQNALPQAGHTRTVRGVN